MIEYVNKDITTVERGLVVHGVNCQGVMGSGVALAIKKTWPKAFERYVKVCSMVEEKGQLLGLAHMVRVGDGLYVGNLFTQEKYGKDGRRYADINAIQFALKDAVDFAHSMGGMSVYMPRIGCGLGGLNWDDDVRPVVNDLADRNPTINIIVCDWK